MEPRMIARRCAAPAVCVPEVARYHRVRTEAGTLPAARRRTMRQSMVLLKPWTAEPAVLVAAA